MHDTFINRILIIVVKAAFLLLKADENKGNSSCQQKQSPSRTDDYNHPKGESN